MKYVLLDWFTGRNILVTPKLKPLITIELEDVDGKMVETKYIELTNYNFEEFMDAIKPQDAMIIQSKQYIMLDNGRFRSR